MLRLVLALVFTTSLAACGGCPAIDVTYERTLHVANHTDRAVTFAAASVSKVCSEAKPETCAFQTFDLAPGAVSETKLASDTVRMSGNAPCGHATTMGPIPHCTARVPAKSVVLQNLPSEFKLCDPATGEDVRILAFATAECPK